ncbi:MAG: hypothetical protein OSA81_05500 [Longimicrobiales bacterium]|nr:hypothetical protein [Longimicrobiales bacterium]
MHASDVTPEVIERVRQLYWHSDESVNKIADALDLSKGALYAAIPHLPSGLGCPLCGDQVSYPNRTARDQEQLDCLTCDWDGNPYETLSYKATPDEVDAEREQEKHPPVPAAQPATAVEGGHEPSGVHALSEFPPPFIAPRMSTIATGALVGGALGLVLVLWARRR